jgi:ABC-type transporter Mla subunit MlaD
LLAQTRHEISFSAQEESEENRVVAFLRKHLNPLAFNKEFSTQQPTEEFDMTPEQLAALQAQMKAQADGLTALSTRVATLATEIKNMAKAPNADEAAAAAAALAKAEADKKAAAPKDFSAELAESLKAVNTSIADLKTQFAELAKKPAAGTTVTPEHGGGGAAFVAV